MRLDLPWYDVNFNEFKHCNTAAGKIIAELNDFLEENWIKWWIAYIDEKWEIVTPYTTGHVVLEIDDSVSQEKLEKIKRMVLKLLRVMGASETQLVDVFKDEIDKEREIQSTKEIIAKLERSISAMNPKTKEEWKDYDRKDALLIKYREKLLHLTHSDEEIKQMEIEFIKDNIANLEKSISIMNPKTQGEWKELDRKEALLKEQREKLQHLTHSYE